MLWNVANAFDDRTKTLTCLSLVVRLVTVTGFGRRGRCGINKEGEPTRSCEPSIEDGIKSIIDDSCLLPSQTPSLQWTSNNEFQRQQRIPKIQFRVLIIGRANAGKTSILQRVCETTDSPIIYRGRKKVRGPVFLSASLISLPCSLPNR